MLRQHRLLSYICKGGWRNVLGEMSEENLITVGLDRAEHLVLHYMSTAGQLVCWSMKSIPLHTISPKVVALLSFNSAMSVNYLL